MQINKLATQTGVSTKTIRYYEEIGVLPPAKRLPNGYRIYDESDLERLRLVNGARQL
jgi:DNA-binding transcriptional MerR regulator